MIPSFLLREVLDVAIPDERLSLLSALVAGMIAIPIVTGVLGVWQTLLSNRVGQAVMHDLRTSVYRHLQRLSLAFFTRTRTGEVQSRIANDIGGIDTVVTSTATSVVSNVTTVLATVIAMTLLDWRLAVFALALLPLFVYLTKRVGDQRRKVRADLQASLADVSSIVQESLSVSGILLGKTMGRSDDLAERFGSESSRLADLEVRSRMTGRWMMAAIQTTFAVMPALVYWFAGWTMANGSGAISIGTLVAFTTLQARLFFPIGSLLGVQVEVQSSLALFDRIFDYLDQPVDIVEGTRTLERARGDVAFDHVRFRYGDEAWTLEDVTFRSPPGRRRRSWARPARARRRAAISSRGSTTRRRARCDRRHRPARADVRFPRGGRRRRLPGDLPLPRERAREPALREARRRPTPRSRPRRAPRRCTTSSPRCRTATTRSSASEATASPAARSNGSPSRGRFSATPHPRARRGDVRARHADRARRPGRARAPRRGPDDHRHRPPSLDRSRCGPIVVLDHGRVVEIGTHEELLPRGGRYASLVFRDADAPAVALTESWEAPAESLPGSG